MTTRIEQKVEFQRDVIVVQNVIDGQESSQRVSVRQMTDGPHLLRGVYLDERPLYDVELFRERTLVAKVGPRSGTTDALYVRIAQLELNPGLRSPGPHLG